MEARVKFLAHIIIQRPRYKARRTDSRPIHIVPPMAFKMIPMQVPISLLMAKGTIYITYYYVSEVHSQKRDSIYTDASSEFVTKSICNTVKKVFEMLYLKTFPYIVSRDNLSADIVSIN